MKTTRKLLITLVFLVTTLILILTPMLVEGAGKYSSNSGNKGVSGDVDYGYRSKKRHKKRDKRRNRCHRHDNCRRKAVTLDKPDDVIIGCKGAGCYTNYSGKKWKQKEHRHD